MGRHSAPRTSLRSSLGTTARLEALVPLPVTGPRARRTAAGTGAALAAVALTATTAAAAFAPAGTSTQRTATPAPQTTSPLTTAPLTTAGAPVVVADPAVIDAASDALVRAEYVTSEQAGSLPAAQAAKIEETRTRLSEAISATGGPADALDDATAPKAAATEDAAVEDAATAEPAAADDAGAEAAVTDEAAQAGKADDAVATTEAAGADADRDADRASRSSARTRLDELAAPLTGGLVPPAPLEPAADGAAVAEPSGDATPAADDAPDEDAPAEPATDAAAAEKKASAEPAEDDAATVAPASADDITALTAELRTLLDATEAGVAVEVIPGPPSAAEVAAQLDQWATSTAGYGNGQIPAEALCELSFAPGELLRCDADHQIEALNIKYREAFGTDMSVTDSYRSYGSQVSVKASRGYYAAIPGTSNHGWGLALDLGGGLQSYGTAQYEWMRANAPALGWDNPEWARAGGAKNEPWHWEYGDLS
ncbi:M15 family metallopeptidase [Cellulosimicrobium sp. Marseille-Q8652]